MLSHFGPGGYRFLAAPGRPFSSGVVADPGGPPAERISGMMSRWRSLGRFAVPDERPDGAAMLKRIDHVGVIVDDLEEAKRFLSDLGLRFDRDLDISGRLRAAFYACGETQVEVIEVSDPTERSQRLGDSRARIEHIAFEVDSLSGTLEALRGLGVDTTTPDPVRVGANLNYWTQADTCDGVQYQLIEKGAAAKTA